MDEIKNGNSNNPLTLAELAYEVNNDIHKMLQEEENEITLLQEKVQEEEEIQKINIEMQT